MPTTATAEELTVDSLAEKRYLRVGQRQELEQSTQDIRAALQNPDREALIDPGTLHKQLRDFDKMLASGTPPEYDGSSKNKVNRIRVHLEEQLQNGMLTFTEMERGRPDDVDKYHAYHKVNTKLSLAWKNCCIILDRNNGEYNFLSISRLRTDTVRGDPRAFKKNWDNIAWNKIIEEDLERDLGDEAYLEFLELKVVEWAKPNICKKLQWTPEMYEAAMQRLRDSKGSNGHQAIEDPITENIIKQQVSRPGQPPKSTSSIGGFKERLDAIDKDVDEFCHDLSISRKTFFIYERKGWSKVKKQEAEGLIEGYTFTPQQTVEPTDPEGVEPADLINAEPVV